MTLVIGILTSDFIVFGADRRRINMNDKAEYYDDMRKHARVNERVIIGFSGDFKLTLECIEYLKSHNNGKAYVQDIADIMQTYLQRRLNEDSEIQQTLLIGGTGNDGKITMSIMHHRDNYEVETIVPEEGHVNWRYAYADVSPEDFISEGINEVIENDEVLDLDKALEIAINSIREVSDQDGYVSSDCDVDYLMLGVEQ